MRQTQTNRRGRGRSRKAQNPLTKNYESNGPDVKIRGTAAHISEKYNSLARDALTASDIVRYENYLQHAEHYNRIIAAAQQNNQTSERNNDQFSSADDNSDNSDISEDEDFDEQDNSNQAQSRNSDQRSGNRNGQRNDQKNEQRSESRGEPKKNNRRRRPDAKARKENGDAGAGVKSSEGKIEDVETRGADIETIGNQVHDLEPVAREVEAPKASPNTDDAAA